MQNKKIENQIEIKWKLPFKICVSDLPESLKLALVSLRTGKPNPISFKNLEKKSLDQTTLEQEQGSIHYLKLKRKKKHWLLRASKIKI